MSRGAKIAVGVAAAVLVVWLLFTVVFPWVDGLIDDPAVSTDDGQETRVDTASARL